MRTIRTISESEVRKLVYPIERFDSLFDFCSSSFILVGLIGTITGFFRTLPQLTDPNYNFSDLRQALATSGFGIAWAILLNLILVLYQRFAVSPLVQRLLEKVSVDQLAQSLAESLERFSGQIAGELQKSLSAFTAATTRAGYAASQLAEASKASGANYQEAMGKAAESAARIHEVFDQVMRLPEATSTSLDKSLEVFRTAIQEVLTKTRAMAEEASQRQKETLNEVVNGVSSKYSEATNALISEQTKFVLETAAQHKRAVHDVRTETIHIMEESNRDFAVSLKRELKGLTASIGEAVAKLTEGATHLSQSIDRYNATARSMRSERGAYGPHTIRNTQTEPGSQPAATGFFSEMWARLWRWRRS